MSTAQHTAPDREWFITANRDLGPIKPAQPGRHRKPSPLRRVWRRLLDRIGGRK